MKIVIFCYSDDRVGKWGVESIEKGLPGSEEAVVYLSQELAKRQWKVTIFANPLSEGSRKANPRWLKDDKMFGCNTIWDIGIAWRRTDFSVLKKRCKRLFFWPHDSPSYLFDTSHLNGVFYLSQHHKEQFDKFKIFDKTPYVIAGNGCLPSQFNPLPSSERSPLSCGYFSNYSRGLYVLLKIWDQVIEKYPSATLEIYYGRETWGTISSSMMNEIDKMIKSHPSISEKGIVGHQELANAMSRLSIWTYPCITESETFCITAVKTQTAGMIPVTIQAGALKEVLAESPHCSLPSQYFSLLDSVFQDVLCLSDKEMDERRQLYISHGSQYTWSRVVSKWMELIR